MQCHLKMNVFNYYKKKINMHVVKQNEGGCVLEEKKREDKHMN